jgi:S1-C subfamily serine protease
MPNRPKVAYRTMAPFDGGLSPTTDKSRGVPLFGNTPLIQDLIEGKQEGFNDLKGRGAWSSEEEEDKSYREKGDEYRLDESLRKLDKDRATGTLNKRWVAEMEDGSEYEFPSEGVARMQLRMMGKPFRRLFRRAATDKVELIRMVSEGCVGVVSRSSDGKGGVGAAFCVAEGHFVTCAHVIAPYQIGSAVNRADFLGRKTSIEVSRGDKKARATVAFVDTDKDIAILKADLPSTILSFSESKRHSVGENVIIIGSPKGYENTVSEGIISSLDRVVFTHDGAALHVFTDAKIFPGNSGGPMIAEADGSVIGLVEIVVGDDVPYGLNAAVASEYVIEALKGSGIGIGK